MGLTGSVKTAPTNFYLAKGMLSQEALLAQMGDGLLLTSLMGLHAGTNAVSGDFPFRRRGSVSKAAELTRLWSRLPLQAIFISFWQRWRKLPMTYISAPAVSARPRF